MFVFLMLRCQVSPLADTDTLFVTNAARILVDEVRFVLILLTDNQISLINHARKSFIHL